MSFRVGENQTNQQEAKHRALQHLKVQSEMPVALEKQQSCQDFDECVACADPFAAVPAFSAQKNPAQNRDIVVERYELSAPGAGRTRRHHGQSSWQPVNTDVQKAAKDEPEQ